jgi:hypothetical protein
MVRDASVGIRIEKSLKTAAEKAAEDDRRSLASLIEIALVEYLERKGYLKKGK